MPAFLHHDIKKYMRSFFPRCIWVAKMIDTLLDLDKLLVGKRTTLRF